jgi:virginiamycin B lyase
MAGALDPQHCGGGWRSVYSSQANEFAPGPDDLAWRGGTLFVAHTSTGYAWVFSMPDRGGGAKNLLYEGRMRRFWLEGDRLLFAQDRDLFEIPQTGGPPKTIVRYGERQFQAGFARDIDRSAIYWLLVDRDTTVWRHLRSGGDDTMLATIPHSGKASVRAIKDRLLISIERPQLLGLYVATVAKAGGAPTSLPGYGTSPKLLGVSNAGALLWSRGEVAPENDAGVRQTHYSLARSDVDGAPPARFQTTIEPTAAPDQAWAAGNGAWYVSTIERLAAGARYLTVWYLKADGSAARLACRPAADPSGADRASGAFLTSALVVDGALYGALEGHDRKWSVAAIENPGAPPDAPPDPGNPGGTGGVDGGGDAGATGCPPGPVDAGAGSTGQITEFPIPTPKSGPQLIAKGPDGALWFGEAQTKRLGRITTSGCITEFPIPGSTSSAHDIVAGPDNYLWFTQPGVNRIGRMLIDGSLYQGFPLASGATGPSELVMGPDKNLWFTQSAPSAVGRMTLTGTVTQFPTPTMFAMPRSVTVGPDGALWFSQTNARKLGRIDPTTMAMTELSIPNGGTPGTLISGPDGNLWFMNFMLPATTLVTRLTPSGTFTDFPFPPNTGPTALIAGPDGNLWIAERQVNKIARMSPTTGAVTEYPVPTAAAGIRSMTVGPDGNIWFTESEANKIGRLVP